MTGPKGVLLLYTGSPDEATPRAVRAYLKRFLMDPRVMAMPGCLRWCLVHGIIAPIRARASAAKYKAIWMPEGSPLVVLTDRFVEALQALLPGHKVAAGSAYGTPTVTDALASLTHAACSEIIVFPMFPHYAEATRGSLLAQYNDAVVDTAVAPSTTIIPPFYNSPAFIEAVCSKAAPALAEFKPDHVVFSYHGLPVRQGRALPADGSGISYEAQCEHTTTLLREALGIETNYCTHVYQSRFGRGWLEPQLEPALRALAAAGKHRVALLAPSFVTDCLETLEELDMRARECFLTAGGTAFLRIPALNAAPQWVAAIADMIKCRP